MEFLIENLDQTTSAIESIKDNFNKEESEQDSVIVRFAENISKDDFLESLKRLFQFEIDSLHTIDILIKNLTYEYRKDALAQALKTPDLRNPIFLQNVFCLVKGYNTFDESYFEHEQVFLNDEVEFLDIFDDIAEEINEVSTNVAKYYVSMLKTCNLVEGVENNPNAVRISFMYEYLFNTLDVMILAKILSSVKDNSIWETKEIVLNSLNYLGAISEKFIFTNSMINLMDKAILERITRESVEG